MQLQLLQYTAISRKDVEKSAGHNPERHCGWDCVHASSSRKFERMAGEAMDVFLRVIVESKKKKKEVSSTATVLELQCIDHIPYYLPGLSRAQFFGRPFSK